MTVFALRAPSQGHHGPARVLDFGEHASTFHVQLLRQEKVAVIHASPLKHYADADLHVNEAILEHVADDAVDYH